LYKKSDFSRGDLKLGFPLFYLQGSLRELDTNLPAIASVHTPQAQGASAVLCNLKCIEKIAA
jgi:hypothetical protein